MILEICYYFNGRCCGAKVIKHSNKQRTIKEKLHTLGFFEHFYSFTFM